MKKFLLATVAFGCTRAWPLPLRLLIWLLVIPRRRPRCVAPVSTIGAASTLARTAGGAESHNCVDFVAAGRLDVTEGCR